MRLAPRLAIAFLVVIVTVLAVHGVLSIRWHARLYEESSVLDQARLGRALAAAAEAVWSEEGRARAIALVEEVDATNDEIRMRWVSLEPDAAPAERPVAPRDLTARLGGDPISWKDGDLHGGDRVFTYVSLRSDTGERAALELSEAVGLSARYIQSRVLLHLGSAAAMIALSAIATLLLGELFVARPVRSLVAKARRIGAGDFSTPLVLSRRDEFAELAHEMNAMASQLDAARQRIEAETTARLAALEQLRHADRLTTAGRLASGIAHELGTPLHVISERARMIGSGEAATEKEIAENARIITQQSARVTHIVRQLLDLTRRRTPAPAPTDLTGLARSTLTLLEPLAEKARVGIRLVASGAPVVANVDAGQIQQALTNVLVNAIEATPAGRCVAVEIAADAEGVRIDVEDEGGGMPPEVLAHAFEPFFTTKAAGAGTGLGLSIAEGIVREHGGRIQAHNAADAGSRISIWLPTGVSP